MDTNLQARIRDILQKNDKLAVVVGKNPSIDDLGAALALFLGLSQLGKKVSIASSTEPLVEHSSLVAIDRVKGSFEGDSGDLIVSFPYREGEIEKVSYTLESGFLNIVVKAGELGLQFKEQDVRYSRGGGVPQVLFIIGTPKLSDLGSLFNPEALKDTTIINVDNKPDNQGFGDVVIVAPQASSVSELVGDLLISLGADIDVDIAQNLLAGISVATENFQSPKTSYLAFEMAAAFMKKGAVRQRIQRREQQSEDQVSSFMPEHMLSQGAGVRNPVRNQGLPSQMPTMPRPQRMPMPRPMPRPQPAMQQAPMQQQMRPQVRPQPQVQPQVPPMPMPQPFAQQPQQMQDEQFDQNLDQIRNDILAQSQGQNSQQAVQKPPSDWLTPKVYKGSSNV